MTSTFADCLDNVQFIQAKHQFIGSEEDELSYNKGDVIVVTKKDDGGWWEGTLDGKIGWFPSNYGKEIDADPEPTPEELPETTSTEETDSYHNQVVDSIIQAQKSHLQELQGFLEKYLTPLKDAELLSKSECETLCGNYEEIVEFHKELDSKLEEQQKKSIPEQRFGACMLTISPKMKSLYLNYCSNHPQAAHLLVQYGDQLGEYMEKCGASEPGIMTLTMLLSKPFIYVEKYGKQIKELQRHVEDNHIDNLDLMKATQVLQIISLSVNEVRKKKEKELQMLTGNIEGWQGEPISTLGTLVIMGQVFVEKEEIARRERYFCLFPNDLVALSVSPELVGYCFEERHAASKIHATNVEDTDTFFNGFILTVSEEKWKVMTSTPREKDTWLKSLKKVIGDRCIETIEIKKPEPNLERSDSTRSDVKSLTILDVQEKEDIMIRSFSTGSTGVTKRAPLISNGPSPSPEVPLAVPDHQPSTLTRSAVKQPVKKEWSFTRLRPTPPWQPSVDLKPGEDFTSSPRSIRRIVTAKKNTPSAKGGSKEALEAIYNRQLSAPPKLTSTAQILEEDMMILSVIEAYCFSARQRQTMNYAIKSSDESGDSSGRT